MKLKTKFTLIIIFIICLPVLVTLTDVYIRVLNNDTAHPFALYLKYRLWIKNNVLPNLKTGKSISLPGLPPADLGILIFDADGKILLSNFKELNGPVTAIPDDFIRSHKEYLFYIEPLLLENRQPVRVIVGFKGALKGQFITTNIEHGVIFFLVILFSSALVGTLFMNSLRKSILNLQEATHKITLGNLDFILPVKGNDEIAALTRSFDHMRNQLKMETARRARFIMAVSHDLKTPLTSIKGYVEAVHDGMAKTEDELKKYMDILLDKSTVLQTRISELIDYVRMETGEWEMKHQKINLYDFLVKVCSLYQEELKIFKRQFTYTLGMEQDTFVMGDQDLLSRVIENIMHNAIRYTGDGDAVCLEARQTAQLFTLKISDSGSGILPEEAELIFEPFYRGSGSRREAGFGLGLSTVKSILNAHNWDIKAARGVSGGTVFTITIQLNKTDTNQYNVK